LVGRSEQSALAQTFNGWLPGVIQAIKPYFSPDDVAKGTRWSNEIAVELEASRVGLLFLTRENKNAEWILFESGALSKSLGTARVCPILFGLEPSELTGPLTQFQAAVFDEAEMLRVVKMINANLAEHALTPEVLGSVFQMWWPKLKERVDTEMQQAAGPVDQKRPQREMLEEILGIVRNLPRSSGRRISRFNVEELVDAWAHVVDAALIEPNPRVLSGLVRLRRVTHLLMGDLPRNLAAVQRFHHISSILMRAVSSPNRVINVDDDDLSVHLVEGRIEPPGE
jgi:hypothetical protein